MAGKPCDDPPVSSLLDPATQQWVRLSGRRVDLALKPWPQEPVGATDVIGDRWLSAEAGRLGATIGCTRGLPFAERPPGGGSWPRLSATTCC